MAGWIKVYRDLQDHWLAQDFEKLGWWVDLLLSATHKDTTLLIGGHLIELKKGQLRASSTYLADRWGKAKRTVQKFLDLLESDKMISRISSHKSTIITICNYDSYQEVEQSQVATKEIQEEPIGSQSVAENKNEKNKQEYNNNTNHAHAREEVVSWDAQREQGFFNTFKGLGSAIPLARSVGKTPNEILQLLDIYMAKRQVKNLGHKDYHQFASLFLWAVENKKVTLLEQSQQKKVTGNAETYRKMQEMGWLDNR